MDPEIISEWREAFDHLDMSHQGMISVSDLMEFFLDLGVDVSEEHVLEMIKEVDKSNLGDMIDFDSFCSMLKMEIGVCSLNSASDTVLRDVFDVFDQDADGFISSDELWSSLEQLFGQEMSETEFENVLAVAGMTQQTKLDFEAFKKLMTDD